MTNERPTTGQTLQSAGCLLMALPAFAFFAMLLYFLWFGGD